MQEQEHWQPLEEQQQEIQEEKKPERWLLNLYKEASKSEGEINFSDALWQILDRDPDFRLSDKEKIHRQVMEYKKSLGKENFFGENKIDTVKDVNFHNYLAERMSRTLSEEDCSWDEALDILIEKYDQGFEEWQKALLKSKLNILCKDLREKALKKESRKLQKKEEFDKRGSLISDLIKRRDEEKNKKREENLGRLVEVETPKVPETREQTEFDF